MIVIKSDVFHIFILKILIIAALITASEPVSDFHTVSAGNASDFSASWSCTTTSPSHPRSAPPAYFPPGWTRAVLQSWMSSCVSTSTRGSCCPESCVSTWTCKVPLKLNRYHPMRVLHASSPQKASQCTDIVCLIFHLLPTLEKPSASPKRWSSD